MEPSQQLRETLRQASNLRVVNVAAPVADTLGHAANHELDHRAVERSPCSRHLLNDRVAILACVEHARDAANLALDATQPGAQRGQVLLGQPKRARWAGLGTSHVVSILATGCLRIPPGVC